MAYQSVFKRYEKKYLLTRDQYEALSGRLNRYMETDEFGLHTIANLYYDTRDFRVIRHSLEKPVYKEKLRMRCYGDCAGNGRVFLELKKKYKGEVFKRRVAMNAGEARDYMEKDARPAQDNQILREIDWFRRRNDVFARVMIAYERIAWAGRDNPALRVTFDDHIRYRTTTLDLEKGFSGQVMLPEDIMLMEIKIPGAMPVWMSALLDELSITGTSFSKYGFCYQNYLVDEWRDQNHVEQHSFGYEHDFPVGNELPSLQRGVAGAGHSGGACLYVQKQCFEAVRLHALGAAARCTSGYHAG